jgi:hypothetical protein
VVIGAIGYGCVNSHNEQQLVNMSDDRLLHACEHAQRPQGQSLDVCLSRMMHDRDEAKNPNAARHDPILEAYYESMNSERKAAQ